MQYIMHIISHVLRKKESVSGWRGTDAASQKTALINEHKRLLIITLHGWLQTNKVFNFSDAEAVEQSNKNFGVAYKWDVNLIDGYRHIVLCPGAPGSEAGFWKMDVNASQ